jgi:hypothetical protein
LTITLDSRAPAPTAPSILEGLSGVAVLVHPGNLTDSADLVWALASIRDLGQMQVRVMGQSARVTFAGSRTVTIAQSPGGSGWRLSTETPARTWTVDLSTLSASLAAAREAIVDAVATREAISAAVGAHGPYVSALPVALVRDRPRDSTVATFKLGAERLTLLAAPGVGTRPRWRVSSSRDPVPWALSERACRARLERLQRALCPGDPGRAESYLRHLTEGFTKRVAQHDAHDFELMGRDL